MCTSRVSHILSSRTPNSGQSPGPVLYEPSRSESGDLVVLSLQAANTTVLSRLISGRSYTQCESHRDIYLSQHCVHSQWIHHCTFKRRVNPSCPSLLECVLFIPSLPSLPLLLLAKGYLRRHARSHEGFPHLFLPCLLQMKVIGICRRWNTVTWTL